MEKVKNFLFADLDFNNLTSDCVQSYPVLEVAHDIAMFFKIDIQKIQSAECRKDQIDYTTTLIKLVFTEFLKILKKDISSDTALQFVTSFEESLHEANAIHLGLEQLIKAIPFEEYKDKCIDFQRPKNQVYFERLVSPARIKKLVGLVDFEYNIIRAPDRFENFLNGNSNIRITVNRDKVGHFVFLINCLLGKGDNKKIKYFKLKKGKGCWQLLDEIVYDFDGKKIAKHEKYFNNLISNVRKKNEPNQFIFNEIEEILNFIQNSKL